ncbi:MAG: ATP synthase F1 subunit delta [Phycisphaerales bacterium]
MHSTADNPVHQANAVAMIYARSAMELAAQTGEARVDEVGDELSQIGRLLRDQPDLGRLLLHPTINIDKHQKIIDQIFRGRVTDLTCNLLQVLRKKGRLDQLGAIIASYRNLLKERRGEVDVDVTSAKPLDADTLAAITRQLAASLGSTPVVHARIDEKIIGGLKIRIGDQLLDGSVATQLARIKRQLAGAGRNAARQSTNE